MTYTKRLGELINGDDGRVAFPSLEVAEILLGESGAFGQLLLCQASFPADSGAIVADEFPHIHVGKHWRSGAHGFIHYSMYSDAEPRCRVAVPRASDIAAKAAERAFGKPVIVNVMRGHVAEAIVSCALEPEWRWCSEDYNGWDFQHEASGVCLEVKQSARLQSWSSATVKRPGAGCFDIALRAGRLDGAEWIEERRRWADIYIFAYHDVSDESANHCDPSQWTFYIVPTSALPTTASISLGPLRRLSPPTPFGDLRAAVASMHGEVVSRRVEERPDARNAPLCRPVETEPRA